MKSRMERYTNEYDETQRTAKNQDLYEEIYNNNVPSSNVTVLANESEIDISKIKELVENREGYNRLKKYQEIIKTDPILEEDKDYDIYEDIDNKIYDINMILEDAKLKRGVPEREKYRNLRNTQYNILSNLNLKEEVEEEQMDTEFFTQDKTFKKLKDETEEEQDDDEDDTTSKDLFDDLKGLGNTILTEAINPEQAKEASKEETDEKEFYTNHLSFTKEDFEGFQNLHTTIKKNNKLIKVLITILTLVIVAVIVFVTFTLL